MLISKQYWQYLYMTSYIRMVNKLYFRKDMEDRECGLLTVTILAFACRVWGKQWKALGKIPGLWSEIWTWDFSNTKEYWPVKHDM